MRSDGRKADEIRRIGSSLGTYTDCDGSAYLEMGNTKVLSVVYFAYLFSSLMYRHGPADSNRFSSELDEKACVECDVVFAPFSLMDHKRVGQNKRISIEYSLALRRCFEKVILTNIYPRSRIQISCTILQSDGGDLPCLLNASLLALVNAGVAVSDFQVSLSVGYMDNTILMDMNRSEAKLNGIVLTVAYLPRFDKFTLVTMDNNIPIELFEVGLFEFPKFVGFVEISQGRL